MALKEKINIEKLPSHVAIIMDGNGRWARKRGNQRIFGHKNGVAAVRDTVEAAAELGIGFLTLYAFSTENWRRPKAEIDALMELLVATINKETKTLQDNNIQLLSIGDMSKLPKRVALNLNSAIEKTKNNNGLSLILALNYSSRWELTNTLQKLIEKVEKGEINPSEINSSCIEKNLETANIPDPELLIRTSGEYRLSNFLLWQLAYAELYFTETLWPDFRRDDLYKALLDYQNRERRFGKTSDQVKESINVN